MFVPIKQLEILNYDWLSLGGLMDGEEHLFKDRASPRNEGIKCLVPLKNPPNNRTDRSQIKSR